MSKRWVIKRKSYVNLKHNFQPSLKGGGGNWEFQWYTNNRSNSFVEDGVLHLNPTLTSGDFGEDFIYTGTLEIEGGTPYEYCTNPVKVG